MTRPSLPCLWEQGIQREGEVGEATVLRFTASSEDYSTSYDELLNNSNSTCMRVICKETCVTFWREQYFKVIYQGETFIKYWLIHVAATRHELKSSSHHASPLIHCKVIVSNKYVFWKFAT
jgi:hypothetical protein